MINKTEKLTEKEQKDYGSLAKERIHKEYTWDLVVKNIVKFWNINRKLKIDLVFLKMNWYNLDKVRVWRIKKWVHLLF